MASVRITKFGGIAPRIHPQNLRDEMAQIAENIDLSRNTLKSWRVPLKVSGLTGLTIWREECCFLADANCHTSYVWQGIGCKRLFASDVTGYDYPVTANLEENCTVDWCRLGFPCDAAEVPKPDVVVMSVTPTFKRELRHYAYTLINQWGEESSLSAISDPVEADSGSNLLISGWPLSFPTYCIEKIRIYRAMTGLEFGPEPISAAHGEFFAIGEVPVGTLTFNDNGLIAGEALRSEMHEMPPPDLRDLTYWRTGQFSGLSGNNIVFSEKNKPFSWPDKYILGVHDTPRRYLTSMNIGYVLTDGRPAIVSLKYQCQGDGCHEIKEIEEPHPIVSRRSAALFYDNVVYASKDGLVMITPQGQTKVLTIEHYAQDQWQALEPETMIGVVHDGHYFGFCRDYAFRFRLPDSVYEKQDQDSLTTLTLRPTAVYRSDNDELFLALDDGIYRWNSGDTFMSWRWKSKRWVMPGQTHMSAYKVVRDCGEVRVQTTIDCRIVKDKITTHNKPYRLPVGYSGIDYEVELSGADSDVREYHLGAGIGELA